MKLLIALVLNALALIITAYLVPGFKVDSFLTAALAAIVIGFTNTILRPIINFITTPINLLTFGLFTFVVNAVILYVASLVVPGFEVDGALPAIIGAVILTVVATILSRLVRGVKNLR